MSISADRAAWLGRHIFPHEAALRQWLAARPSGAGLEIDDIVQESYAILATLKQVDHILNPRTYLFQVAKSVILQTLRKSRVVTIDALINADVMALPEDRPSPERVAADREELAFVAKAIAQLPPKCRQVFTLRKIHGLSQREVAKELNISESTVEKHVIKALAQLTNAIGRGGKHAVESSSVREHRGEPEQEPESGGRERA